MSSEGIIMDQNIDYVSTLDITGDPDRIAIAWAHAAGAAGAYWPAAFAFVVGTTQVPIPSDHTRSWLREAIRLADQLVSDIMRLESEAGLSGPAPRQPEYWSTDDDGELHLAWDTSVSLIISSVMEPGRPGRLRLVLYGQHETRERLAREALERPAQIQDHIIRSWRDLVSEQVGAIALAEHEREIIAHAGSKRLEALAAYARLRARV